MKKLLIITLFALLASSIFASEREIRISHKVEEGKIPQTIISNYDADYLATGKFDKETMTNYFVTIYTNKNGIVVQCNAIGKDADFFTVIEKDRTENILATLFYIDFDKTWKEEKCLNF